MSEIQALSYNVGFSAQGTHVSLLPHFRAKNDNLCKVLSRFFAIKSLAELVGPEEEACLCPVRALKTYLARIQGEVGKATLIYLFLPGILNFLCQRMVFLIFYVL